MVDLKLIAYKLILGGINLINFVAKPFLSILKTRPILSGFLIGISFAAVAVKLLYFGAETWPNAIGSIIEHLVRSIDRYFLIEPEPPKVEQHTKLSDFTKKSLIWAFAVAVIGLGTINTVTLIFGFNKAFLIAILPQMSIPVSQKVLDRVGDLIIEINGI